MKNNLKLAVLIFLFPFCFNCPGSDAAGESPLLDAQKTISMDLQDANLKDVLKIFSIQSGLNFIAAQNVENRKVTLYLDRVPLKEAMNKLFEVNNLTYKYDDKSNIYIVQYWGEPEAEMITKIFRLRFRSILSSNIEKERSNLFAASSGISGSMSSSATGSTPAASAISTSGDSDTTNDIVGSIKQVLSKNGKISEDSKTNSLIITDIPSRFPVIEMVIAQLDVSQPQVMLEVEMLDVSKNILDRLGFQLGDVTSAALSSPFTLSMPNPMALTKANWFFGDLDDKGKDGYVSLGRRYALLLDFLSQQSDTKFLARPRVLTLNNETAEIGVTRDEIVSVQETVSVDSTGHSSTARTYQRATSLSLTPEGIGIFLRVTPMIDLENGEITMVINPKTSSTSQSPDISSTTVARDPEVRVTKSIVKVKDGETIVMGGLIHREKGETLLKVPILGDIPIIGLLFRHKTVSKNLERELLVFITPRIIKEPGMKLVQNNKTASPSPERIPSTRVERQETINSMLNVFEKRKNGH
jgi:type II secretory pathway component GspD/PulD (secretin)